MYEARKSLEKAWALPYQLNFDASVFWIDERLNQTEKITVFQASFYLNL